MDDEYVAAIVKCLRLRIEYDPEYDPEWDGIPDVPFEVRRLIGILRATRRLPMDSTAADLHKLIRLLRKHGWDTWADEVEERIFFGGCCRRHHVATR
jgi:hypothetical protein